MKRRSVIRVWRDWIACAYRDDELRAIGALFGLILIGMVVVAILRVKGII